MSAVESDPMSTMVPCKNAEKSCSSRWSATIPTVYLSNITVKRSYRRGLADGCAIVTLMLAFHGVAVVRGMTETCSKASRDPA